MKARNKFRSLAIAAGLAVALTLGSNAEGRQAPPANDTVPRQEYEQLRREMLEMRQRLDALEQSKRQAPTPAPASATPRESSGATPSAQERGSDFRFELTSVAEPNWIRAKGSLGPDYRTEQMDLRIGQTDSIDLYIGLQTVGRVQDLNQKDVSIAGINQSDPETSFQTPWGDLAFLADIEKGKMEVFFDLYISSRPHPSTMYGNEGYMIVRELPDSFPVSQFLNNTFFKFANVKAGDFEVDFGDHRFRRSDNAWVQRNLLIGNSVVDPDAEEIGMEIYSKADSSVGWLVGVTSGTTSENFSEGRGIASVHGKLWKDWTDEFRTSVSGYYVDHSDNPASGPGSTKGALFTGQRSGGAYGAILSGGNGPGQVLPGRDQRVTAFQADVTYTPRPIELYANIGWMQDSDPDGSVPGTPQDSWTYGTIEAAYFFNPRIYTAARYSFAMANELDGNNAEGIVHRIQIGGGYWATKNILAKIEGVYQTYQGFDTRDGLISGVDAGRDPSFYGVVFEVSFAF